MLSISFQAERRSYLNPSKLKQLRKSGRLPGIMFGHRTENEMFHISAIDFQKWLKLGASGAVKLQFSEQETVTVLLEDVQRNPVTREPIHVDFQQLQQDTVIRTKLKITYKGTPVGKKIGGVVQIQSATIEVESLPKHLPDDIEVDISDMDMGSVLFVKDIPLPEAVTVVSDPNDCLLSIVK